MGQKEVQEIITGLSRIAFSPSTKEIAPRETLMFLPLSETGLILRPVSYVEPSSTLVQCMWMSP
jgi:hypothetical protein